MSYILDALQRADAERDRGTVPGLHSQPLTAPGRHHQGHRRRPWRTWWILALLVCTGAALCAGWWFGRSNVNTPEREAAPTAPQAASAVAPAAPSIAAAPSAPSSVLTAPAVQARPAPVSAPSLAPVEDRAALQPLVAASTPARSASAPLPWLAELPEATRRQIAPLAITGAVYSENPSQRLLLVNGQVLPQGSVVVPDVTLEEIREHHAVFNFRGSRFRLAH